MQEHEAELTGTSGEAVDLYRRVKFGGSTWTYADIEEDNGTVRRTEQGSGDIIAIRPPAFGRSELMVASGTISAGANVYPDTDGKVTATVQGKRIGKALTATTTNGDWVEVERLPADSTVAYANEDDSSEVENTTDETAYDTYATINGADLRVGDVIEVFAQGHVLDQNATDSLNNKLYLGTEEICATGAVQAADDQIWTIHAFIVIRAVGASGAVAAMGTFSPAAAAGSCTTEAFAKSEASEDLSGSLFCGVKATWSAAHADNEAELENIVVILHRH